MKKYFLSVLVFFISIVGLSGSPVFSAVAEFTASEKNLTERRITVSRIGQKSAVVSLNTAVSIEMKIRFRIVGESEWNYLESSNQNEVELVNLIPGSKYEVQCSGMESAAQWSYSEYFESKPLNTGPNMLIIVLDDARYDTYSKTGASDFFQTPAIDRIANEGVNFEFSFPVLSACAPSRASIMTGLYPHNHGVINNDYQPDFDKQTIAPILHDAGYYVGFIGKYGFKKFPNPGYDYFCESATDPYWNTKYYNNNSDNQTTIVGHKTTIFTEKAFEFFQQVPDGQPWLLYLFHKAPHVPLTPRLEELELMDNADVPLPANFYQQYQDNIPSHYYECNHEKYSQTEEEFLDDYKSYYELLAGIDWSIDTIFQYLDAMGITDSTLILFTSDNGLLIGDHFLSGKELALEQSIRIPMFIRYPKWFPEGTVVSDQMALNIDIGPTMLDAAGIDATPYNLDGTSMRALYNGTETRTELFYEHFNRGAEECNPTFNAISDFSYKYVQNACTTSADEFYDLTIDSLENFNFINDPDYFELIDEYKAKLEQLKIKWNYINLRDTLMGCRLDSVDSTSIDSSIVLGSHFPEQNSFLPEQLSIYPNPTGDFITVDLDGFADDAGIQLYNVFGQLLYKEEGLESIDLKVKRKIDVSGFPPGTYLLVIRSNGRHASIPFVRR
jgi:N-acetylglucosamine-6-sulfatase